MSQREQILITVRTPVQKLPSPNLFVPEITVEVRAAWPPNATWESVHRALDQAAEEAYAAAGLKMIGEER